jgi:putative redox protein
MATIKITALGDFSTKAIHLKSGSEILTDAPTDNKGKGENFSPTDLLSASLGACMVTIMDIASKEHGFEMAGTEILVTKIMAENPRRVAEIIVELNFPDVEYSDKAKRIIEHASKNCPVALSLHPDVKQTIILNYKR